MLHGSPIRHAKLSGEDCSIRTVFPRSIEGIDDYQAFCRSYYYDGGVRTIMRNRAIFDATEAVAGALSTNEKSYAKIYDFFLALMTRVIDTLLATELDCGITVEKMLTEMYREHYAGDETITPEMSSATDTLVNGSKFEIALDISRGIFIDTYPADNNVDIIGGKAFLPDGTPCADLAESTSTKFKHYIKALF